MGDFAGPGTGLSSSEPYETGVNRGFEDVLELVEAALLPAAEGWRSAISQEIHVFGWF